jgi:hypothetical protein
MPVTRAIADVESEIRHWIQVSTQHFDRDFRDEGGKVWVLKYFPPQYLEGFLRARALKVSTTRGFTWGDGVYVAPLIHPYSTMMYGRAGVLGWIDGADSQAVYDASRPRGIELYQEWIEYFRYLFRLLTTTMHADFFNRLLRNKFRRRFDIDIVLFPPDQYNRSYVAPLIDRWFVVADWPPGPYHPGSPARFSAKVRECEWIMVVVEDFLASDDRFLFRDLIGPHLAVGPALRIPANRANLVPQIRAVYAANRAAGRPAQIITVRP